MFLKYLHYSWKKKTLKLYGLRAKSWELTRSLIVGIPHFTLQCHRNWQKKKTYITSIFRFRSWKFMWSRHIKKLCKKQFGAKTHLTKKNTHHLVFPTNPKMIVFVMKITIYISWRLCWAGKCVKFGCFVLLIRCWF